MEAGTFRAGTARGPPLPADGVCPTTPQEAICSRAGACSPIRSVAGLSSAPVGPAGYKVRDFVKSGGVMTGLFLVISLVMLNVVF